MSHEGNAAYQRPQIVDIGDLRELTAGKPKFGPAIPAYRPYRSTRSKSEESCESGSSAAAFTDVLAPICDDD